MDTSHSKPLARLRPWVRGALVLLFVAVLNPRMRFADLSSLFPHPNGFTILAFAAFFALALYGLRRKGPSFRFAVLAGAVLFASATHVTQSYRGLEPFVALQDSLVTVLVAREAIEAVLVAAILVLGVLTVTFFFGNVFCGWVCPFGALHEFLFIRRIRLPIPGRLDRALAWLRFPALLLFAGTALYAAADPFLSLFAGIGSLTGMRGVLVWELTFFVLALFIYRPFCRYLCPVGALLSIAARLGLGRVQFGAACTQCGVASAECPTGSLQCPQRRQAVSARFDGLRCVACGTCVSACRRGALRFEGLGEASAPQNQEPGQRGAARGRMS